MKKKNSIISGFFSNFFKNWNFQTTENAQIWGLKWSPKNSKTNEKQIFQKKKTFSINFVILRFSFLSMTHIFPYKNRNRHDFLAWATVLERKSIREFTRSSFSSLGNKMGGSGFQITFSFREKFLFFSFFWSEILYFCGNIHYFLTWKTVLNRRSICESSKSKFSFQKDKMGGRLSKSHFHFFEK